MNKIFKVLWSKTRNSHVVTNEAMRAHGKGRQGVSCVCDAGALTAIGAAAVLAFSGIPQALAASSTIKPGWTHTQVTTNGNVHNVTTDKIQNGIGINKFVNFNLVAKEIANLKFGDASKLLNFVDSHITVDGVVNAVKDNKIGGDLYFVSPTGMTVGSTGVINAGSLTVAIPTQSEFDRWWEAAEVGSQIYNPYSEAFLQNLETGAYPINPTGVITVKGSIHAGNRIALSAAQITIGDAESAAPGGRLETGIVDFGDLVNITDEKGAVTADAGLGNDLSFTVDADSGDIVLTARAEGDDGTVRVPWDDGEEGIGQIQFVKTDLNASITVAEGATVKAAGDVTARASASNTSYDTEAGSFFPEPKEGEQNVLDAKNGLSYASATATVTIDGTVEAAGDVKLEASTVNVIDHTFGFNFGTLTEELAGSLIGGLAGSTVEYVNLTGTSLVTVGASGSVLAAGDLTLEAKNRSYVEVGDSTAWKNYTNLGPNSVVSKIPIAAVAVGSVAADSRVVVNGALRTDGDLSLAAVNDFDVDIGTIATVQQSAQPQASFVYADTSSNASVTVGTPGAATQTAGIGTLTEGGKLGKVTAKAETLNRVETSAETYVSSAGNIAAAVNITDFDADANVSFAVAPSTTMTSFDVDAINKTETLDVLAKTTVGDNGILMKLQGFASDVVFDKIIGIADKFGKDKASGTIGNSSFNLGGAIGVVTNNQSASVTLDPTGTSQTYTAEGDIAIQSASVLADHHYEVTTKQQIDANQGNEGKVGQGALAVLVVESSPDEENASAQNVSSSLTLDAAAELKSLKGLVELASTTEIEKDRFAFLKQELEKSFDNFATFFRSGTEWAESIDEFEKARKELTAAFEALGSGESSGENFGKFVEAMGAFVDFLAATFGVPGEASGIFSTGLDLGYDIIDIVNPISYTNAYVSAGSVTNNAQKDVQLSLAASVGYVSQSSSNTLLIDELAKVSGQQVTLEAAGTNESIAMGGYLDNFFGFPLPNRDDAKAVGATVVYHTLETDNRLEVADAAQLTAAAGDLRLSATDALDAVTITASAGANAGGLTVSGLAAVTNATGSNTLWLDDEANLSASRFEDEKEIDASDVELTAERSDSVQTVAGALGLTKSENGGTNASVGMGVAVNLGGLTNRLAVDDADDSHKYELGAIAAAGDVALTAESTANVNAIGVAGQVAAADSGTKTPQATDALDDAAAQGVTEDVSRTQTQLHQAIAQNSGSDSDWISEGAGNLQAPTEAVETPDISTESGRSEAQKTTLNLAAAGSFAWNDFDVANSVTISSDNFESGAYRISGQSLIIEAVTDKWIGAIAGAAGVAAVFGSGGANFNASIGGAAAINNNAFTNSVVIKGLSTDVATMNVASLVNGTTLAEGLGMAVAAGQSSTALGIDAGVSVNFVENTVGVAVDGLANDEKDDAAFVYDQVSWSGETQVTGGTAAGVAAGGSSFSGAVGAAVAVAGITNNITSTLTNAELTNVQKASVQALASLMQVNTAVGAQVAQGSGTTAAISGSVISADITNNVTASASNSSITMADVENASFVLNASTAGTGEGEAAHAYAQRAQGIEGVFTRDELLNTNLTTGIALKKDNAENGASMDVENDILEGGDMRQVSVALGVGVGAGGTTNAAGSAGVLVTNLANTFSADSSSLTLQKANSSGKDFGFAQTAATGVRTVNVAAGVSASAGGNFGLSAAGSVVVSGITQIADSTAENLELDAAALGTDGTVESVVAAENKAHTVNVAGNASVAIGSSGAGVGAAVVVSNILNTANAQLADTKLSGNDSQAVAISADNEAQSWSAAVNGTVATNAAVGGSVVKNTVSNNALAFVKNTVLDGLSSLYIDASDASDLWTLSGNVAVSYKLESAAVGGAVSYVYAQGQTKAEGESLTVSSTQSTPDIAVAADAADEVHTLTLGLSVSPAAGIAGSVGINTIDRTVAAALKGLGTTFTAQTQLPTSAFGTVNVSAQSRETIENLGIVVAGAAGASVGAGTAVNTIGTDVDASIESSVFKADRVSVAAKSASDIETIGVGAAVGGMTVGGSVAVNRIENNTNAVLKNSVVTVADAAAVTAQSDDMIGTYGGQATYGGTAGLGLSVSVAERTGTTAATVENAKVEETGQAADAAGLTVASGVADEHINDSVVEDVTIGASLEDDRTSEQVDGVRTAATSTATYKTVLANAAASGIASMQGVGSSVTHAGKTTTEVRDSTLASASSVDIAAGDYANFDTVMTAGGVSANAAAGVAYAGVTTKHETTANITESNLSAPDVRLMAEAKEGVSSLGIIGEFAMQLGASALANATHQGSSVATLLSGSTVTGARYAQQADYLGRITNLGVAAAGSLAASGAVSVFLNTAANDVASSVVESKVEATESIDVQALRTSDWNQTTVTAGLGAMGAATAFVAVNTIEGQTATTTEDSTLGTTETDSLVLGASNTDAIDLTTASANASLGYSLGASVLVNQLNGAAALKVDASKLTGTTITAAAEQNRFVDAESIYGSAALTGGLSANIVSTVVGDTTDDFAALFGGNETGLTDSGHAVEGYVSSYGGTETIEKFLAEHGEALSEEERKEILANAAQNAAERLEAGTHAVFLNTTAAGETIDVSAREDQAEGAGVDVTVGSGTGSLGAALAASVATLNRHHNVEASITGGSLTAKNIAFGALAGADDKVTVIQVAGGLASGQAAWTQATNDGSIGTLVAGDAAFKTTADDGDIRLYSENTGSTDIHAQGVSVGGVTAGGMIARLSDASEVYAELENAVFTGDTTVDVDRAQTLKAHAMAGYGGAASGVGAQATVTDSGNAQAVLTKVTANDDGFELAETASDEQKEAAEDRFAVDVNLHPTIEVLADSAGGGGLTVGVVEASADISGLASLTVTGGTFDATETAFTASAGRKTDSEADALAVKAAISGYGGSAVGINVNKASVKNTAQVKTSVASAAFGANSALEVNADAYADYDMDASAASGGLIRSDNNELNLTHSTDVSAEANAAATSLKSLAIHAQNVENARLVGKSAGGSVIDIGARAVQLTHNDASTTTASIGGSWTTSGDISVSAATDRTANFSGRNTTGTVAGGNGVGLTNAMTGETLVAVEEGAALSAGGSIDIASDSKFDIGAVEGEDFVLDSGIYGAVTGGGISLENTQTAAARVAVGKSAALTSADAMTLAAETTGATNLAIQSRMAGAFGGATSYAKHTIHSTNEVTIDEGAKLKTTSPEGVLTLAASADEDLTLKAIGNVEGAAGGGSSAKVDLDYARTNNVELGKNAVLRSGRSVNLYAGRDAAGRNASLVLSGYTYAVSHAAIAPVDSEFNDTYAVENTVKLSEGSSTISTENISAAAVLGDFATSIEARYYNWTSAKDAGTVEMATTEWGTVSNAVTQTNAIEVDGSMLAGVNTRVDLVLDGMVDTSGGTLESVGFTQVDEPSVTITTGAAADAEVKEDILANIEIGSEQKTNEYWSRHETLQQLISELSGQPEQGSALAAYRAEDAALIDLMLSKGLAEKDDDGSIHPIKNLERPYVTVDGITVSGGNIAFTTDKVSGAGNVKAQTAEGISVTNNTNLALEVSNINVLTLGGGVSMNGVSLVTGDKTESFSVGSLTTASSAAAPTIDIVSNNPGTLTYRGKDSSGSTIQSTPDTSVVISGDIINNAGSISIHSEKDIIQRGESVVNAYGSVQLEAKGAVTQFYSAGITNVGPDVEDQFDKVEDTLNGYIQNNTTGHWESNVFRENSGDNYIVAGGDVIISGQMVNINGTVQSGYTKYELTLEDGQTLEDAINAVKTRWQQNGSKENINVRSDEFLISKGESFSDSHTTNPQSHSYHIAAWYDPVNDRIVVDDIVPEGGHVYITGGIASTGFGKVYAAQGSADIKITVGSKDLQLGTVDTGNIEGLIRITDTNYRDAAAGTTATVTEITMKDGAQNVEFWGLDAQGNKVATTLTPWREDWGGYTPLDNLVYMWSWGYQTGQVNHYSAEEGFTWWGGYQWDRLIPQTPSDYKTEKLQNDPLTQGSTIVVADVPLNTQAQGDVTIHEQDVGAWEYKTWTTYDDALHWRGTNHVQGTQTITDKKVATVMAKADEIFAAKLISGSNTIDIDTGGSLLLGGAVRAQNGTIDLNAAGDILNHSENAVISGAKNLTLTADGSIGSAGSAIRITGSPETMTVAATAAGGSLYLDATGMTADTLTGSFTAKETVSIAALNDLSATSVKGTDIALTSQQGGIAIENLVQTVNLDNTQRLDVSAAGDIAITATEGDLGLGQVVSNAGDVSITVEKGSVFDAISRETESGITAQERIDAWKAAGLIGENGENIGQSTWEADVAQAEAALANDYARYEAYRSAGKNTLSEADSADFAALETRFGKYASLEAALAGERADTSTNLGAIVAAKDNYGWTQNDLLYAVADAIANPDPGYVPTTGEPNIKGNRIIIATANGSIGLNEGAVTGSVDSSSTQGLEMLKLLAQADVDDVSWHSDGTVTVQLKRPITIESTALAADAGQNIFIQSTDESTLNIEHATAVDGAVRLTSKLGVYAAASGLTRTLDNYGLVQGKTVTIRGGDGGIGSQEASIIVKHADDGWAALSGKGDIFVDTAGEDLTVYAVSGGSDVTLKAGNITSYTGEEVDMGDESFDFDGLGYIGAGEEGTTYLDVAGNLGNTDNALRFAADTTLVVSGELGSARLATTDEQGTFDVQTLNATGVVDIQAADALRIGNIEGSSIEATAGSSLVLAGTAQSTSTAAFTAVGDISASGSTLSATEGSVRLTSAEGSVNADKAQFTAATNVTVTGATGIDLSEAAINKDAVGSSTSLSVVSAEGDLNLTNVSAHVDSLTATAETGSIAGTGLSATASGSVTFEAQQDVQLADANLKVGSVHAAGNVTVHAETGDAILTDAKLTGSNGTLGAVSVTAGKDVDLTGTMNALRAESVTVSAGETTDFGDDAVNVTVTNGNFSVAADNIAGSGFGSGSSYSVEQGEFRVDTNSDLMLGEGFNVEAQNVAVKSDDLTAEGSATIRGHETVALEAAGDVALTGDILITSEESVGIVSETGGIALNGAVTVGDETTNENKASVSLIAQGDVTQSCEAGEGGIRASDAAVVSREGSIDLNAGLTESSGKPGNSFDRLDLEAAKDITVAATGRDTEVTVNKSQNGDVDGDLVMIGKDNGFAFTNSLSVDGDIVIDAAAVKGQSLEATGSVGILTALDESLRESDEPSGVEFTGSVSGSQVSIITENGGIRLDHVASTDGPVDIYRVGSDSSDDVSVNGVESSSTVTIFNNRGNVVLTDTVQGHDNVFALTGIEGTTTGAHHLTTSKGAAGALQGMDWFADEIVANLPSGAGAGGWNPSELPQIRLDGVMSDARHSTYEVPLHYYWSPTDVFFFLNLRPDASSAKGEEDEESRVLEDGLPQRGNGVIRDLRTPDEAVPPDWILSLNE